MPEYIVQALHSRETLRASRFQLDVGSMRGDRHLEFFRDALLAAELPAGPDTRSDMLDRTSRRARRGLRIGAEHTRWRPSESTIEACRIRASNVLTSPNT